MHQTLARALTIPTIYIEPCIMFNAAEAALQGAPSSSAWEVSTFMSQFHTYGN